MLFMHLDMLSSNDEVMKTRFVLTHNARKQGMKLHNIGLFQKAEMINQ